MRKKIVDIARSQLGIAEPTGDDKYIQHYNDTYKTSSKLDTAWCAIFVTWCRDMAGAQDYLPNYKAVDSGIRWFKNKGQYKLAPAYGGDYIPKEGDIIFFSGVYTQNDGTHTGIVSKVTASYVYSIEGNSNNAVRENKYKLTDKYILGYGCPDYPVLAPPEPIPLTYTVVKGDTLSGIAKRFNTTVDELVKLNNIENPSLIRAGQTLRLTATEPSGSVYTVTKGDTLSKIAKRFNTTVEALVTINSITNPSLIRVGQVLKLPSNAIEPVYYAVVKGDSLWKIAKQFNTTVAELIKLNGIVNAALIHVGQVVRVK